MWNTALGRRRFLKLCGGASATMILSNQLEVSADEIETSSDTMEVLESVIFVLAPGGAIFHSEPSQGFSPGEYNWQQVNSAVDGFADEARENDTETTHRLPTDDNLFVENPRKNWTVVPDNYACVGLHIYTTDNLGGLYNGGINPGDGCTMGISPTSGALSIDYPGSPVSGSTMADYRVVTIILEWAPRTP